MTETVVLGDHLDFAAGSTPPSRASGGRRPVYGANGVIGYTTQRNARGPLIVIGRVGSHCGSVHYCEGDVWVTDNALIGRARNPDETRYWFYALKSCGLNRFRSGSGQPSLSQSTLRSVPFNAVSASRRRPIGALLGAFDDKLAANARVIAVAEALMTALVEQVDHDTALSDLAERSTASIDPRGVQGAVAHYSLPAFDAGTRPALVDALAIKSTKFLLTEPCVLFSRMNPRIPRIWNVACLPAETALASTEFVVLRPIGVHTSVLWAALRQRRILATLQQMAEGVTGSRQRIRPHELLGAAVRDVRRLNAESAKAVAALSERCERLRSESEKLAAMRDALLSVVISGGGSAAVGEPAKAVAAPARHIDSPWCHD
ncbi:restriction endonuclease subunit S [Mycobacterium camsae]|uniref:restriction endonuclease subunit S n=1 Tax=Mycobacterium gordonae TaxID=1778 RepID=UPI001F11DFA9|nr:restriction endonuclease subunit S [Mycobacterium gordonae]